MITETQVAERIHPRLLPLAGWIAQLANIIAVNDELERALLDWALSNASGQTSDGDAMGFRDALLAALADEELDEGVLASVRMLPPPNLAPVHPPGPPPPPPRPAARPNRLHKASLQSLRTPTCRRQGVELARMAISFQGCFCWMQSSFALPGASGETGAPYMPSTVLTSLDSTGRRGLLRNHFARWLVLNKEEPTRLANMNCWQVVFFTAFSARLIDKVSLLTIHQRAARVAQSRHRDFLSIVSAYPEASFADIVDIPYGQSLMDSLRYFEAVPYLPDGGLIPQAGDVIFWDCAGHVAISLGRIYEGGVGIDYCMSLWRVAEGHFVCMEIGVLTQALGGQPDVRFVPCPFSRRR